MTIDKNDPPIIENSDNLLREYILNPQLPIHNPQPFILPRPSDEQKLYHAPLLFSATTTLEPRRDPLTRKIVEFIEVQVEDSESTAQNSMSMRRAPICPEQATRGSATNFPFWPGGFDEPARKIDCLKLDQSAFETNLLCKAPGFNEGIDFTTMQKNDKPIERIIEQNAKVDLLSIVEEEQQSILGILSSDNSKQKANTNIKIEFNEELDEILLATSSSAPILEISTTRRAKLQSMEYAEWVDITQPVNDFNVQIPEPAHTYPFELDTFQKQAIIKLENHNHVFVAAHTSAGKTVVAEYAIALSQKHMTRAIYTSPIKALSNQKYRDFKKTFDDVGIITGDIQINPSSACLIMTTEILRSMLYCGSEVTRDLEYVIFDEVHYITDIERGHVWEEVLILLPDHVNIIMLSATVPNALEFSNWVGMTKRKKVYVISTMKRPVPLKHYLYTGHSKETKKELFLLVDADGRFINKGYLDAKDAKARQQNKNNNRGGGSSGGGGGGGGNYRSNFMSPKHETQLWLTLIDVLKQTNELPIIAFTLSRVKCDRYVKSLESLSLTTGAEAGVIKIFFSKCLSKLKPEDRVIPQVLMLQDSLARGIGVHHSGILPILKEVVEMLFQRGHVKLLFATETFAMGINMPARTVVFDSYKKHDGKELRPILPAEYTQMAGRAGRRGLDKNGTVIMLCKTEVPSDIILKSIITGKPKKLESKFRLTYAMILNLFRVESVTVEDMMSHSFKEFESQVTKPETMAQLQMAENEISKIPTLGEHLEPLCKYYSCAYEYISLHQKYMSNLAANKRSDMKPGKILIISCGRSYNRLAILLSMHQNAPKPIFKVLAMDVDNDDEETNNGKSKNSKQKPKLDRGEMWHRMIALTRQNHNYMPENSLIHQILTIEPSNIIEITKLAFKIDAEAIINNWTQRQMPRFRDAPIGQSTQSALTEFYNLHKSIKEKKTKLQFVNLTTEFKTLQDWELLKLARKKVDELLPYTKISNFEQEFSPVYDRKQLEAKQAELKFKMSNQNLTLYPEYQYKLEVLKRLNYIDDQHAVTLKGRVACEMGSNELMITELVLCNTFTDLDPAEIAALLSSLVFQGKTLTEIKLTDNLIKCIDTIKTVDQEVRATEDDVMKNVEKEIRESAQMLEEGRLNFGMVQVVYEWARNKPFAEIMTLTDIQEGVIVRCIQQLNETLQDVKDAARIIGNPALHQKMEEASNSIKRDIVFAASLYFQE